MLRVYVACRRVKPQELEAAERRLAELREIAPAPTREIQSDPVAAVIAPPAHSPENNLLSAELMRQIDDTHRRLAKVCNSMHDVPKNVACPELMAEAIAIKNEEEDLWTQYRYLERNGRLPEETKEEEKLSKERSYELLDAIARKKAITEKKSKLKKKLSDPKNAKNKNRTHWEDELTITNLEWERLDELIKILKDR